MESGLVHLSCKSRIMHSVQPALDYVFHSNRHEINGLTFRAMGETKHQGLIDLPEAVM